MSTESSEDDGVTADAVDGQLALGLDAGGFALAAEADNRGSDAHADPDAASGADEIGTDLVRSGALEDLAALREETAGFEAEETAEDTETDMPDILIPAQALAMSTEGDDNALSDDENYVVEDIDLSLWSDKKGVAIYPADFVFSDEFFADEETPEADDFTAIEIVIDKPLVDDGDWYGSEILPVPDVVECETEIDEPVCSGMDWYGVEFTG